MLRQLAAGEKEPAKLAALADPALRASAEQLQDALSAAAIRGQLHRDILKLFLARLDLIESQIEFLDDQTAASLGQHHDAVQRLAEVPGFGIDSAQQIIAEVGPTAATFRSPEQLSYVGGWVSALGGKNRPQSPRTTAAPKATA
jgi:transposase